MSKKLNSTVMALLMILLVSVPALALPDNPPTSTLSVNDDTPLTSAVLTAVAVDTLANAGVASIKLYENGNLIDTKDCNSYSSCVFVKTVSHSSGQYVYYSESRDKSGQTTQSNQLTVTFSGGNQNPVIDSSTPTSSSVQALESDGVDFSVSAHDPDGDTLSYQWFVDLSPVSGETSSSYHFQPSVQADTQYTVTVEVYDGNGGQTSDGWYATIIDEVTAVDLTGTELLSECDQGTYTVSTTGNNPISDINWDFGDGTSYNDNGMTQTHQFPGNGVYTVTVTVTDTENQVETATLQVTVEDSEPTVDIIAPASGSVDEAVTFDADVTPPCHDQLVNHTWDFGDGTAPYIGGDTLLALQHTYTESGVYNVTLTVCDEDNCVSDTHTIAIDYLGPVADFDYNPVDPAEGDTVQFVDQSQTNDANGLSYAWDLDGDGIIDSTDANPEWEYAEEGDYTVTLTVTDSYGSDSHTETITIANNSPVADFTATPQTGDEDLTVDFSCTYTGGNEPVDVTITFGDGSPSVSGPTAQHTYTQDGNYTATCLVEDTDGDSDQLTLGIEVYDTEPVADFTWDPTNPLEGNQVLIDATVTAHDEPVMFTWDFGDGSTEGNVEDPAHTYSEEGTYTVTMTVTDNDGSIVTVQHDIIVMNNPPVVDLVATPQDGDEPLNVEFICVATGGNDPMIYTLNFGDGSSVLVTPGMPILHSYYQNGTYDATCTVSDIDGDSDSDTEVIDVYDTEPTADFTWDPTDPLETEAIDFTSTISGYDIPLSIEWDFGDGDSSVDPNPTHAFDTDGTYTVVLTVTDADGSVTTATHAIVVGNDAPDVMIDSNPTYGPEGIVATITCTWQDGNAPFEWYISFGDGSAPVYNQSSVNHEYITAGTYTAECYVTDNDGDTGSDSIIINIDNNVPELTLEANPPEGMEPLDVTAVCNTTSGNGPFDYEVSWGDGSAVLTGDDEAPTFGGTHTYEQDGIYTIQCDVWDADNDHSMITTDVEVLDSEPEASFNYWPLNPTEGNQVDFDATITGYDTPLSWEWDLDGDGIADSTEEDPSFTYAVEGDYNVSLTVTDADGSVVTVWEVVSVSNNAPFVNLEADPVVGPENTEVTFTCEAVGGNPMLMYTIDFGDGSAPVIDQQVVTHVYTQPGSYSATCTVGDVDGDSDDDMVVINIANNPPIIDSFTAVPNPTTEGQTVYFDCQYSGGDDPTAVLIDFGDGTTTTDAQATHTYALEGDYTASCVVTDNDMDTDYEDLIVEVTNNPPIVNLVANTTIGLEPQTIEFTCNVGAGNEPFNYEIDFGDGSPVETTSTAVHTYPTEGTWQATCTVTDNDGDIGTDSEQIVVLNNPPVINFVVDPTQGVEGDEVDFDCQISGGNEPMLIEVGYGDGATTGATESQHTYPLEGNYTAYCDVTDADGDHDRVEQVVEILNNPPIVDVLLNTTSGYEPLDVSVECSVGDGNEPFDYEIDWGDGSPEETTSTATHQYPLPGHYDITCSVTDVDGDFDSDTETIYVIDYPPVITDYIVVPTEGPEGTNVYFDCQVTDGNLPLTYLLDFGDGVTTVASSGWHTYPLEGVYTTSCLVQDADGDFDYQEQEVNITNNPPVVNLEANITMGDEPLAVDFTCNVGAGNAPFDYEIDFGDGTAPVAADSASHVYTAPGAYDAVCTVTDVDSDVGSDTELIVVLDNAPVVNLVATPTEGPEGISVDYDCQVFGGNAPFDYVLDFGDGTSSTNAQETKVYGLEGLYTATCTVTDADLDVGTDTVDINVTNNAPIVNLFATPTTGDEPLTVEFDCQVGGGNPAYAYEIDFGDGSATVTTDAATHTYATPGNYDATCTVVDIDGDSGTDLQPITVANNAPLVTLYATPTTGTEGMTVDYDCQVSGGNAPLTYLLTFGDGTSTTSSTASKTYGLEGVYTAICTVTDADLDVGTDTVDINVTNNAPIVNLWTNTTSGDEPLTVEFDCQVGSGNAPMSYEIDFGDGSTPVNTQTAVYTYATPGSYDATCTVYDVDGDMGTDLQTLTVADNPPVIDFVVTPTEGPEGTTVDFDCQITGGNSPFNVVVDYGDGQSTPSLTSSHYYGLEGVYTTSCTVQDADGDLATATQDVNITNDAPIVNLVANVTSGPEPLDVEFTCNVGGGNAPLTYSLDFGDGSAPVSADTATHTYAIPGNYDATCTVTDTDGDIGVGQETILVANDAPVANLIATPNPGPEGTTVDFDCQVAGGNLPLSFVIAFGDGTTANTQQASHTYPLEGVYTAVCTVTDADLDVGTDTVDVNITNFPPVANLVANVTDGEEPLTVNFTCWTGDGNPPFTYVIDFDDGSAPVNTNEAVHTYTSDGEYLPTCTVTDTDGDVDVDTRELINVTDSVPNANFSHTTPVVEGAPVTFTDLSTAYDGVVAWEWDFESDGVVDSYAQNPVFTFPADGNYLVELTVTDGDGSTDSYNELIVVQNDAPTISLTVVPDEGEEPLTSTVTCGVVSGGNSPFTYLIQYGDGDTTTSAVSSHQYDQDGLYGVVCTVTDNDGDIAQQIVNVNVTDTVPTASFTWTPLSPNNGEQVDFTDTSIPGHDAIVSWEWDFDNDGTIDDTNQNPSYTYATGGIYMVNLTVTDADGSSDDSVRSIAVATTPGAPVLFNVAVDTTHNTANVTWATDQATDSLVEWGLTNALGNSEVDSGVVFDHNVELTGLTPSTTYYFNLTSCNSVPECTTVGVFSFTTDPTPDTTPPAPVSGLGASDIGVDWIEWVWANPADADYDHADIYVNGTWYVQVDTPDNTVNVSGLSPDTDYTITVVTVDTSDNENLPGVDDTETTLSGADITPPAPVTGLADSSVGDTWIEWSWTNPADLDFDHVEVWVDGVYVTDVSGTSYNATGFGAGTGHTIEVITVDGTGNRNTPGQIDAASTTSTVDVTAPVVTLIAPTDAAVDADGNVTVFAGVTDDIATSLTCTIYSNTSGSWQADSVQAILSGTTASFDYTGLADGTYEWNMECSDGSNVGTAAANWTFEVNTAVPDTTAPVVTLLAPLDASTDADGNVTLQYTVSDDMASSLACSVWSDTTGVWQVETVQPVLNGAMSSYALTGLADGTYEWNVVCDDGSNNADGGLNWTFTVDTSGTGLAHDIAVLSINYTKEGSTVWLDDALEVNATVENQGTSGETFTLELEVDGVVVQSQAVTLAAGATSVETFNWAATPKDYRTVTVRAQPVAGETDLADQAETKIIPVISADDVVDLSTRYAVYWSGVVYVPVLNAYNDRSFDDLRVELSSATAVITPPLVQYVDLGPSQTVIVMWNVAALPGDVLTVTEGNNELSFSTTA